MNRSLMVIGVMASWFSLPVLAQQNSEPATAIVSIELVIAEFSGSPPATESWRSTESGDANERLKQLEKLGRVGNVTRVELTSLTGATASLQMGERVPVASGRTMTMGGRPAPPGAGGPGGGLAPVAATNYQVQSIGTLVKVTPSIGPDQSIVLILEAERSRLASTPPEAASDLGTQSRIVTLQSQSTIRVKSGQTILISGARQASKENSDVLILVTARIVE